MMTIRTQLRTLATATLLVLATMTAPANLAHASSPGVGQAAACSAAGYNWDDKNGCDNKSCDMMMPRGLPPGQPDDFFERPDGKMFWCDGKTGHWNYLPGMDHPVPPQAIEPAASVSGPAPLPTTKTR